MSNLVCNHCGGNVEAGDEKCAHCGMPLPPNFARSPQKKFILYFIALVIFCAVMIVLLPQDWYPFTQ